MRINTFILFAALVGFLVREMVCEEEFEEEDEEAWARFWNEYCLENPDDPDCFELYEDFE